MKKIMKKIIELLLYPFGIWRRRDEAALRDRRLAELRKRDPFIYR